MTFLLKITV